jgi:hypothetical protein
MILPKWNDPQLRGGTMIRTALWLISEIGVGNSFTKEQHRQAFSRITQADRRLRDLRDYGWVIHTHVEDLSLNSNEQRLVSVGKPVWERGVRKDSTAVALNAKMRMAIFAQHDYQCAICGIAGGEKYPDAPHMTAVLSISRRSVKLTSPEEAIMFIPECKRCRSGKHEPIDLAVLVASINKLDPVDRIAFVRWIDEGRRGLLDHVWADFRRLSPEAQEEVCGRLTADR